jgi:hypothetical protein
MDGGKPTLIKDSTVEEKDKDGVLRSHRMADMKATGKTIDMRVWVSNPTAHRHLKIFSRV